MNKAQEMLWEKLCPLSAITPGTGVCALLGNRQIALFRPTAEEQLYAIDNIDPLFEASVLSRGLLAEHEGELWVARPLKKQRYRLKDGYCSDDPQLSRQPFAVRVRDGQVELSLSAPDQQV